MSRFLLELDLVLASPGDIRMDCDAIEHQIKTWNRLHSHRFGIRFRSLRWEEDSPHVFGMPPQEVINQELIDKADGLIALFWTRLGQPTKRFASGTIEEINRAVARKIPSIVLHCNKSLPPSEVDHEQIGMLESVLAELKSAGFVMGYHSNQALIEHVDRYLTFVANEYVKKLNDSQRQTETVDAINHYVEVQQIESALGALKMTSRQIEIAARSHVDSLFGPDSVEGSEIQALLEHLERVLLELPDAAFSAARRNITTVGRLRRQASRPLLQGGLSLGVFIERTLPNLQNHLSHIEIILRNQVEAIESGTARINSGARQ